MDKSDGQKSTRIDVRGNPFWYWTDQNVVSKILPVQYEEISASSY